MTRAVSKRSVSSLEVRIPAVGPKRPVAFRSPGEGFDTVLSRVLADRERGAHESPGRGRVRRAGGRHVLLPCRLPGAVVEGEDLLLPLCPPGAVLQR